VKAVELIVRKRGGGELALEELEGLVQGYMAGEVPEAEMAAFLMAVVFRGMSEAETLALTQAMVASGRRLDLAAELGRQVVDKHSTGGVGDKLSLVVGPIVAACGVPFAKMSGRGLGHTGGTIDKLEAIPGYRVELTTEQFVEQVRDVGRHEHRDVGLLDDRVARLPSRNERQAHRGLAVGAHPLTDPHSAALRHVLGGGHCVESLFGVLGDREQDAHSFGSGLLTVAVGAGRPRW
jgi:hypothetical protein